MGASRRARALGVLLLAQAARSDCGAGGGATASASTPTPGPAVSMIGRVFRDATCSTAPLATVSVGSCGGCGTGSALGYTISAYLTPTGVSSGVISSANVDLYFGDTCTGQALYQGVSTTIGECTSFSFSGSGVVGTFYTLLTLSGGGGDVGGAAGASASPSALAVAGAGWVGTLQLSVATNATVAALRASAGARAFKDAVIDAFVQAAGGAANLPASYVTVTDTTVAAGSRRRRALQAAALAQVSVGFSIVIVIPPTVYTAATRATWDARMALVLPAPGTLVPPAALSSAVAPAAAAQLGVPASAIVVTVIAAPGYATGAAPPAAAAKPDVTAPVAGGVVGGLAVLGLSAVGAVAYARARARSRRTTAKVGVADSALVVVEAGSPAYAAGHNAKTALSPPPDEGVAKSAPVIVGAGSPSDAAALDAQTAVLSGPAGGAAEAVLSPDEGAAGIAPTMTATPLG